MTKLLTVVEMAAILNTSEKAIYAKVSRGELPHMKFGQGKNGSIRFDPNEIAKYLDAKRVSVKKQEELR